MSQVTIDLPEPPANAPSVENLITDYLERLTPALKAALQETFRQWLEQDSSKLVQKNPFEMSFDEFEKLTQSEQSELRWQAFSLNKPWIDDQLRKYQAEWILVMRGKVQRFSSTLDDVPTKSEIKKIGRVENYMPFLFIREPLIEEGASVLGTQCQWAELADGDFYPSIGIAISPENDDVLSLESNGNWMVADLDTGSPIIVIRGTDIERSGIRLEDYEETWAVHLGIRYRYVTPKLQIAIQSESQGIKAGIFRPRAVYDWTTSPFVLINPNRTALAGRNLLLQLGLDILLKSQDRKTVVI